MSGFLIIIIFIILIIIGLLIFFLIRSNKGLDLGAACDKDSDCATRNCSKNVCQKKDVVTSADGAYCNNSSECNSGNCVLNACTVLGGGGGGGGSGSGSGKNNCLSCTDDAECESGNCLGTTILTDKVCQPKGITAFGQAGACCFLRAGCENGLFCTGNPITEAAYGICRPGEKPFYTVCNPFATGITEACDQTTQCLTLVPGAEPSDNPTRCLYPRPDPTVCNNTKCDSNFTCRSGKCLANPGLACYTDGQCTVGCNTAMGAIMYYDANPTVNKWTKYVDCPYQFVRIVASNNDTTTTTNVTSATVWGLDLSQGIFRYFLGSWKQVALAEYPNPNIKIIDFAVADNNCFAVYKSGATIFLYKCILNSADVNQLSLTLVPVFNNNDVKVTFQGNSNSRLVDVTSLDAIQANLNTSGQGYGLSIVARINNSTNNWYTFSMVADGFGKSVTPFISYGMVTCSQRAGLGSSPVNVYPFSIANMGTETKIRYIRLKNSILYVPTKGITYNAMVDSYNQAFNYGINYKVNTFQGEKKTIVVQGITPNTPEKGAYLGTCPLLSINTTNNESTLYNSSALIVGGYDLEILDYANTNSSISYSLGGATFYIIGRNRADGNVNLYVNYNLNSPLAAMLPGYYNQSNKISAIGNRLYMYSSGYCS